MTLWIENTDEETLINRLGKDVYEFLFAIPGNRDYLYDHHYLFKNIKSGAKKWQLSDYSPFVLHICKLFENSLFTICKKLELFKHLNKNKKPFSLRQFFNDKRVDIQKYLTPKIKDQKQANVILDKLFSTVNDYYQRNDALHPGKLLKYEEIENYDHFLSKLRELVELLLEHKLIRKHRKKRKVK